MNRLNRSIRPAALFSCAAVLSLGLSACATPETRLRAGLADAGLSDQMSNCMASYMVDRLSLVQLRRLQSLSTVKKVDYRRITLNEFLYKVRGLKDPELITVTGKAALSCAL